MATSIVVLSSRAAKGFTRKHKLFFSFGLKISEFYVKYEAMENTMLFNRINSLPQQIKEEVLDFMEFLLEKKSKNSKAPRKSVELSTRKLGLLESTASFTIKKDFKMTDKELLTD